MKEDLTVALIPMPKKLADLEVRRGFACTSATNRNRMIGLAANNIARMKKFTDQHPIIIKD